MTIKVNEVKLSHTERLVNLIESHPGELFSYLELLTELEIPSGSYLSVIRRSLNTGKIARIKHLNGWVYGSPKDIKKAEKIQREGK